MANILIIPYSHQLGSTHSLLEIARILKSDNHNIIIAGEGYYMKFAEESGFKTMKLREIEISKYREQTDKGKFNYLSYKEIKEFVNEELKLFKGQKIDLVIDTMRPTTYISTKVAKIHRISLNYAVLMNNYKLQIKVPESHILYKLRFIPPLFFIINKAAKSIRKYVYLISASPYRKYMKELGIRHKGIDWEKLISGVNTFIYDVEHFAPLKKHAKSITYIGAILFQLTSQKPKWLNEVVKKSHREKKKIIYLSMGTTGMLYPKILEILVDYARNHPVLIIGNTCAYDVNHADYAKEKDVFLVDFAPADYLMPIADVVITHGGRGTIYQALKHNVPIIGIPHQAEQEWNLQRCEKLGLGKKVSKKHFSSELFIKTLEDVLRENMHYRDNCKNFSKSSKKYDPDSIIRKYVSNLLAK